MACADSITVAWDVWDGSTLFSHPLKRIIPQHRKQNWAKQNTGWSRAGIESKLALLKHRMTILCCLIWNNLFREHCTTTLASLRLLHFLLIFNTVSVWFTAEPSVLPTYSRIMHHVVIFLHFIFWYCIHRLLSPIAVAWPIHSSSFLCNRHCEVSFNPCFFASALVSVQTVQQSLYCLLPSFFLRNFSATHLFPFLEVLDYHHPLLLFCPSLKHIPVLILCLDSAHEAASHLHTCPHHLLCSCDTTIYHGIRPFCLLLCFFRFWVWIAFFFLFCLAVSYFEGLSFHHFFSASSVRPSPLLFFQPVQSVCLSNLQLTVSPPFIHIHFPLYSIL